MRDLARAIRDDLGNNLATLFQHPHDNGFALATLPTGPIAADERLIYLDLAAFKHPVAVYQRHMLADFVADPPRAFVGDAQAAVCSSFAATPLRVVVNRNIA